MRIQQLVPFMVLASLVGYARADLVNNGSFETFATSGTGITAGAGNFNYLYRPSATGLPGWTVNGQSIDIITSHFATPPSGGGTWTIDLVGSEDGIPPGTPQLGGISQTIENLTAGATYRLSFNHSVNVGNAYGDASKPKILDIAVLDIDNNALSLSATVGGASLGNNHVQYSMINGTRTISNMQWLLDSVDFTSPGTSVTILLSAAANSNPALTTNLDGPVIDMVSLTQVPEPTSISLLAASTLLLLRRRVRH